MLLLSASVLLAGLQLAQAVNVYLSPQPRAATVPQRPALSLSRYLGLEFFDTLGTAPSFGEMPFVAQGEHSTLLLTVDEIDAKEILPSTLLPAFALSNIPSETALSSLLSAYRERAEHAYTTVFSSSEIIPSDTLDELPTLTAFLDAAAADDTFAALELTHLAHLRRLHGASSPAYRAAATAARAALARALDTKDLRVAVLTFAPPSAAAARLLARQSQSPLPGAPPPSAPPVAVGQCFADAAVCTNATGGCAGRGTCVAASRAGKTCFACACTQDGKGTWVGERCERKDVSGPFVLITGTVIVIILLIAGSVSLLSSVGGESLPSTLLGGVVGGRKE